MNISEQPDNHSKELVGELTSSWFRKRRNSWLTHGEASRKIESYSNEENTDPSLSDQFVSQRFQIHWREKQRA